MEKQRLSVEAQKHLKKFNQKLSQLKKNKNKRKIEFKNSIESNLYLKIIN